MNKGILYGIAAYAIWGVFPVYWKFLQGVPALQIMTHRIVWSFIFVSILVSLRHGWKDIFGRLTRRMVLLYLLAGCLLAVNWLVYIYSVNAGFIVESSLGYFINPLVNVLLGVIFLRERLRPLQWVPVGLAGVGVLYLTISYGHLPWIALALAFSFGFYGLLKKLAPLGSLPGLTVETAVIFLPALGYLLAMEWTGSGSFGHVDLLQNTLLVLTGVVTAVPLLFFAEGARRIPLAMMGLLQYLAPTLQFLFGVLVYGEPFTPQRMVGFSIIWLALLLYSVEGLVEHRRALHAALAEG
ncbi:MAG TPA: EamA family transporter RarD [Anaerolinea thermolimosa]|uniref:EamA family transporter RarD n=1 Tax=Anaerolinea thermolimosa TaxID=229919 RepID=A0A3D1JFM3_9CHLR|nr:EamA family transporter RarD [Anaerolinea thermolimosa]